jgi:cytochrome c
MGYRSGAALAFTLVIYAVLSPEVRAQEAGEGERLFRQRCISCHALDPGPSRAGPHLDGIIGRRAGSIGKARYSRALQESQIVWDEQLLDSFLANPRKAIPGTSMMIGVPNGEQRQAIITYLKSVSAPPN